MLQFAFLAIIALAAQTVAAEISVQQFEDLVDVLNTSRIKVEHYRDQYVYDVKSEVNIRVQYERQHVFKVAMEAIHKFEKQVKDAQDKGIDASSCIKSIYDELQDAYKYVYPAIDKCAERISIQAKFYPPLLDNLSATGSVVASHLQEIIKTCSKLSTEDGKLCFDGVNSSSVALTRNYEKSAEEFIAAGEKEQKFLDNDLDLCLQIALGWAENNLTVLKSRVSKCIYDKLHDFGL